MDKTTGHTLGQGGTLNPVEHQKKFAQTPAKCALRRFHPLTSEGQRNRHARVRLRRGATGGRSSARPSSAFANQALYAASDRNSTFTTSNGKTMPPPMLR